MSWSAEARHCLAGRGDGDATVLTVRNWGPLSRAAEAAVEAEAASLPLPGLDGQIVVRWQERARG